MPGADHGLARHAGVGQRLDHELGGHLEALAARRGRCRAGGCARRGSSTRGPRPRRAGASGRSRRRRRRRRWRRRRAGSAAGRPARRTREPGSGRSTTSPSACRSATRLDTVERLSPVRRAMSAREIWPSSRSARITRRRLRRRRDSSEPARPGGMESVPLERDGDGPSTYRTDRPPRPGYGVTGTRPPGRRRCRRSCPASTASPCPTASRSSRGRSGIAEMPLAELAQQAAAVADRAALAEVVDADAERLLAERLAGRAALEVREVRERHDRRQRLVERRPA